MLTPDYNDQDFPVHFARTCRQTACGLPTDFAIHTDEPALVSDCPECIMAASVAPTGCPGGCGGDLACSCYLDGYNAGLAAALASAGRKRKV